MLSSRVLLPCVLFTEALTSSIQQPGDDAAVVGFAVVRHLWLVLLTPIVYATLGLIVRVAAHHLRADAARAPAALPLHGGRRLVDGWPIVLLSASTASPAARGRRTERRHAAPRVCVLVLTAGAAQHATLLLVNGPTRDDEPLAPRRRPAAA